MPTTTHPPLDPELAAVLTLVHEHLPASVTPADIDALRANPVFAVAEETLRRDGTVEMRNLSVRVRRAPRRFRCWSCDPPACRRERPSSTTCTGAA
jgi:hypothetical protein